MMLPCRSEGLCEAGGARKWALRQLRALKLDGCKLLTDADIYRAVAAMPELRSLSLEGSPGLERPSEQVGSWRTHFIKCLLCVHLKGRRQGAVLPHLKQAGALLQA